MSKKPDVDVLMKAAAHRQHCSRIARQLVRTMMISPELDLGLELNVSANSDNEDALCAWVRSRVPIGMEGDMTELRSELRRVLDRICEEPS